MQFKMFKKIMAVAMAAAICVPAFATQVSAEEQVIETDFGVYAPTISVNVPTRASVTVSGFFDKDSKGSDGYSVSSGDLGIVNTTVDEGKAIPLVVTAKAAITKKGKNVLTEYNNFEADSASAEKRIHLDLVEAKGAAAKADGSDFVLDDAALDYKTATNKMAVTEYGSKISINVAAPELADDKSTVKTASAAAFAIVGTANTGADWSASDLSVRVVYDVKASQAVTIGSLTAPAAAFDGKKPADAKVTVSGIGTAQVVGTALHAPALSDKDFIFNDATVAYDKDAGTATVTIPKNDATLTAAAGLGTATYDLVVVLSDGRVAVTTLEVTGK